MISQLLYSFLFGYIVVLASSFVDTIKFQSDQTHFTVPEDTPRGTKIYSFTVEGNTNTLSVVSMTEYVKVQPRKLSDQILNVDVILDYEFDNEYGPTSYKLVFMASESDSTAQGKRYIITLIVEDVNDETPEWQGQPYSVTVKENAEVKSVVYTVRAVDLDNADTLHYTLSTDGKSPFTLGKNGNIILSAALDFETQNFYQYTVTATDLANHTASSEIFIKVEDVQDTPPEFLRDYYSFTVSENTAQGIPLHPALQAIDGDRGVPNDIELSIVNGTCPDLLSIDATSGRLSVKTLPDRDEGIIHNEDGLCNFWIKASEIGPGVVPKSPSTSHISIAVTITDENDNGPKFSQSVYTANIDEGAQIGVPIVLSGKAIAVQDIDQINNAKFRIAITKPLKVFEVTPFIAQGSADILIKVLNSTAIDFEENKSISIELEARDEGNGTLSSKATVQLTINNVNDFSPEFDQENYNALVLEDSSVDTEVIAIHATDGDAKDPDHNYNEVRYSLRGAGTFFKINDVTGVVSVAREGLDREKQSLYYLNVVATDGGGYRVSTSLTITIKDKNDQHPIIKSLQYQTFMEEQSTDLKILVQVQASDADEPNTQNSEIVYSIDSTVPDTLLNTFHIDPRNGTLSVLKPLLYESIPFPDSEMGKIIVNVMASDKGVPPLNSSVEVVVTLEDMNNQSPHCESQLEDVTIRENLARFTVTTIKASDGDGTAPNNEIRFTLDPASSNHFTVDSSSGEIKTWAGLDYEAAKNHSITVTVTDLGLPPNVNSCQVFVQVLDVNDVPPAFENKEMIVEVKETDNLSFQCFAHDVDENHDLKYNINWEKSSLQTAAREMKDVDQSTIDRVTFDAYRCTLAVEPINREEISMLLLQIEVEDKNAQGKLPQLDTGKLTIQVLDVNDNKPVFVDGSFYSAKIKENLPAGSLVGLDNAISLKVTDADADDINSKFELKLLTHNATFAIEPSGGISSQSFRITVINSTDIDFEINQQFTLELEVTEVGTKESFTNSAQVKINLVNENDNSPEFDQSSYKASIPEDSPLNFSVVKVQATDKDDLQNKPSSVTYSFDRESTFFTINQNTGEVSVTSVELNREVQQVFYLTVIAEDGGGRKESCALTVVLTDKNDNDPIFLNSQYETSVEENSTRLRNPVQVEAKDVDEGINAEIVYALTSTSPENLFDFFDIDPKNGTLTMLKPLLYGKSVFLESNQDTIILTVSAFDKGEIPRNSSVSIFVRLEDINNNIPRCGSDSYDVTVKENLENFQIIKINASDEDRSAPNNRFLFSIDGTSEDLFAIDSTSGKIVTRAGLDFEKQTFHTIVVSVTDLGYPPQASSCRVEVAVQDVNDVSPKFDTKTMELKVKEGVEFSYPCPASDPDLDRELIYSIDWDLSELRTKSGVAMPVDSLIKNLVTLNCKNCSVHVDAMDRELVSKMNLVLQVEDLKAEGNQTQTGNGNFIISILDENDEKPSFVNGTSYTASIQENMPAETLIKFKQVPGILVEDKDADESNSKFEVTLLTHNTTFKVEPHQGTFSQLFNVAVLDSSKLDYERNDSFTLQVQIQQIDSEQTFSSVATVELSIENENDNFPNFERPSYQAFILEESSPDTNIIVIQAQDEDKGNYGQLKYSFKEKNHMFSINETTGQVKYTSGLLDFESGQTTYSLAILATDGGNFTTTCQLVISVEDVNDNPPEFLSSINTEIYINENQLYFYPSLIVQAKDKDSPGSNNSKIIYSLQSEDDTITENLQIDEETGEITIKQAFDFEILNEEQKRGISFSVVGTDMGAVPLSSNISLSLVIADVNDESPQFANASYFISVPEDTKNGSKLLTVHADDKDSSDRFNTVTYSLDSASMTRFYIDSMSGDILLLGGLDRETDDSFTVVVSAADNGTPARTDTAAVTVIVTDVNDTPPKFSWESKVLYMEEGWEKVLAVNLAEDKDLNHTLEYSIVWEDSSGVSGSGNYMEGTELKAYIKIDGTSGEVIPVTPLDREQVQQYQLSLTVEDKLASSASPQIDTALLKIVVEDINDNIPEFEGPEHIEARVKELAQVGTALTFMNFSVLVFDDADGVGNDTYNIAIVGDDFTILPTEGRGKTAFSIYVKNRKVLDYEQNSNLTLMVVATETKNPEHTSNITITLYIENENDNFPTFDLNHHTASVLENVTRGAYITTMKAKDEDKGIFGDVEYFIDGEETRFLINNLTGEVTLGIADLDFESSPSYLITVGARDGGQAVTMTRLEIFVEDVNDNHPQFEGLPYVLEIKEGETVPLRALHVQATDSDAPDTDNSKITYSINRVVSPSIPVDTFHLNNTTGELRVSFPLDFESLQSSNGEIIIEVVASDSGVNLLESFANITVKVLDKNDETPKFVEDIYTPSVKENSLGGVFVTAVSAVDRDGTEPNNDVYYVVDSGGQDKFQMNSSSGELVVGTGADLDRETLDVYTLTVLAIDKGSPPRTGTVTVQVTVEDVNDASPTLARIQNTRLHVKENADVGEVVVGLSANDKDLHPSLEFSVLWEDSEAFDDRGQQVNLSLVQDWFFMNSTTGVLSVFSALDRETAEQILVKAQVKDAAAAKDSGPQIDKVTLNILIEDINDNAPVILNCDTGRQLSVSEATAIGTEITTFSATDRDKDQNVQFTIENESSLTISDSGQLSLARALDREKQAWVNFTIIASDSGSPAKTSRCDVHIIVEDANDNDPEFTSTATDFSVSEDAQLDTVVGHIRAEDKDEGGNGRVTFDFMDSVKSAFAIDAYGNITVIGALDREAVDLYSLTVIASDNPENPVLEKKRASTRLIHIHIEDENDQTPVFDTGISNSYSGIISEKQVHDYTVPISPKRIFASDQDIGRNADIAYFLQNPVNNYFKINSTTGQVLVNEENLNGLAGIYVYTIVATDHGVQPLYATVNLTIKVLDENINSPQFVRSGPIVAIPECTNIGSSIYTFVATDDDKDKTTNGKVTYSLDTGTATDDHKSFSIDLYSGVLTTRKEFDREEKDKLQIQVRATDHGKPALTTLSGLLTIHVSDVNDNPPNFLHLKFQNITFNVTEGPEAVGSIVGHVKAQDEDSNTTLTYKLLASIWSENFIIESDGDQGGTIKLAKPMDRENVETINLQVIAVDESTLSIDAVCNNSFEQPSTESEPLLVQVHVTDVDDNPPVFSVPSLNQGFLSISSFGYEIVSLPMYVDDKDSKKHSIHRFYQEGDLVPSSEILKGWSKEKKSDPIKVDVNGSVVTNFKFPDDVHGQFQLRVKANDSAGEDVLEINIYVVGSSQVVYLTFYFTENDLMLQQLQIAKSLSGFLPYEIVPDNILPFNNKDGSVDGSKSILAVHALDKNSGDIIPGETLLKKMDTSSTVNSFLQKYKILNTQTASSAAKSLNGEDDDRTQYILTAAIALMAIAFVITLFLLLNNIQRFKRKLKAATLEVHAMSVVEAEQYPGLDHKIKSSNPVFMRDDLSLDNLDDISQHSDVSGNSVNSLDLNNVVQETEMGPTTSQSNRVIQAEEQEMTIDLYDQRQQASHSHRDIPLSGRRSSDADLPPALQFLNATLEKEEGRDGEDLYQNVHPIYDEIGPRQEMSRPNSDDNDDGIYVNRDASKKISKDMQRRPNHSALTGYDNYSFGYHVESTEI